MNDATQKLTPDKSVETGDTANVKLQPAPQIADRIAARKLIGRKMLIVLAGRDESGKPIAIIRKKNGGDCYWFRTGTVVREQLDNARLPTWAKMTLREGKQHSYYVLTLAKMIGVERIDNKLSGSEPLQPQSGGTPSCTL